MARLYVIGDSLSSAVFPVVRAHPWPERAGLMGSGIDVLNRAIPTIGATHWAPGDIRNIDFVAAGQTTGVLMLGTNDAKWSVSTPAFLTRISMLLEAMMAPGRCHRVLLGLSPEGTGNPTTWPLRAGYNAVLRVLCDASPDLTCLDLSQMKADDPDPGGPGAWFVESSPGVWNEHLTSAAHEHVAGLVATELGLIAP